MKTQFSIISTALFLILSSGIFAQNESVPHICGSHGVQQDRIAEDPHFARSVENLNQRALDNLAQVAERSDDIYTIPVVVHVIHEGEPYGTGSNITDEQVMSSIVALNEDFRKLAGTNGDGDGVDCNIEFCLAARDPEGNSSSGINRVDGSVVADYAEQGIEANGNVGASEEDVKALSTWPRQQYMNVWVVNEIEDNNAQSGIQGYAYFPINSPVDGIVVLHNAFGTVGNLKSNTDLNRTMTHEVGHYLSLYHTFQLTNTCDEELNCSTQGDRVCDTPPTILNSSCSQPACGGTQQVENYMDYTSETCRNMFTEGQKLRMRSTIENDRATLLTSLGCVPVTSLDAGITNISAPDGSLCDNIQTPVLTITNFGSETLTSFNVNYRVDAGPIQSFAWSGSLSQGNSTTIELPEISAGTGIHNFIAYTTSPNGASDENPVNDQLTNEFEIAAGAALNLAVELDYFGTETTWEIKQEGEVIASGGPYVDYQQGLVMNHAVCLNTGCYQLRMQDAYGDGQGFQTGNFELTDQDGNQLVYGEDNWGAESLNDFCVEASSNSEAPVANFSISNSQICTGESVNFSDLSSNSPTSWFWTFEGSGTSSSQNPQNITFNNPGTFTVTLTATNQFGSDTYSSSITVSGGPQITLSTTNIDCYGASNGEIQAEVSDGILPYVYSWSNNSSQENLTGLGAGNYSLTVTDAAGCNTTATASISSPQELNVTVFKSDISCHGLADGSASASASGGLSPYAFLWSNGVNGNFNEDLSEGSFSITVTDQNGCTAQGAVEIVEPSALSVTTSVTAPESCAGNDGSGLVNVMGGTPNYTYDWSNGSGEQSASNLGSGIYSVTVYDANACNSTAQLEIPYDCEIIVESTQLIDDHCGMSELTLDDEVSCNPVEGAEMYQWKFSNLATGFFAEEYTIGSNTTFQLSNLMGMSYGQIYEVNVRAMKDEVWSAYGQTCTIQTASDVPSTFLAASDCQLGAANADDVINCEPVTGASNYVWRFVEGDHEYTAESSQNSLLISSVGLMYGLEYEVSVKAIVGLSQGTFGEPCYLVINSGVGVEEIGNGSLVIYPNPSTGHQLNLNFTNLFTDQSVIECGMYDMRGKMVDAFSIEATKPTAEAVYTFRNKLAPGMYLLKYELNGKTFEEKLIVQ